MITVRFDRRQLYLRQKFNPQRRNYIGLSEKFEKGITLIEIIVVIFIIASFSVILISDFPKIQRQYALSRATYKLAQDLRRTQDLGLSGVQVKDNKGDPVAIKGYGVYIDTTPPARQYLIYADVLPSVNGVANQKYDGSFLTPLCIIQSDPISDCVIEIIDISEENASLSIAEISGGVDNVSINFSPPDPVIDISSGRSEVTITLSNGLLTRTVSVNKSGLIAIQ